MWESLLKFLGLRAQARGIGATAKESNTAAATQVMLDELAKKAAKEAAKK